MREKRMRRSWQRLWVGIFLILGIGVILGVMTRGHGFDLSQIKLPKGFKIEVYAKGLDSPRSMVLGDRGTLFFGTRGDRVYGIEKGSKKIRVIGEGLNVPNGVAFKGGDLYVAEIDRVIKYEGIESRLGDPGKAKVVYGGYPKDGHHGWKILKFGPDEKLYVPVGAPCNVCERRNPKYSTITRLNGDGSGFEIFAYGVRNSVGFDWQPGSGDLWFTDNGRDWMGDNLPPDELNHAPSAGLHFGFPYCHGKGLKDPKFGRGRNCKEYRGAKQELGPHVAALGMIFYRGKRFPSEYRNQIFIAEHGSWNRSEPIGYRVSLVRFRGGGRTSYESFASGWLAAGRKVLGRPVDVIEDEEGRLLISDDRAGIIYRIDYEG